jgi:hypothetical protein
MQYFVRTSGEEAAMWKGEIGCIFLVFRKSEQPVVERGSKLEYFTSTAIMQK